MEPFPKGGEAMLTSTSRRTETSPLLSLRLEKESAQALHRQLYDQLREAVLGGRLAAGTRLPSTRTLAGELGCSRNTVMNAFDLLLSEGYLEGQVGSGTYVSRVLPEELLTPEAPGGRPGRRRGNGATLSVRGRSLAALPSRDPRANLAFTLNMPELASFPFEVFARQLGRVWRAPSRPLLQQRAAAGFEPLRRAIASYLKAMRALDCEAEQVIVTSGTQHALDLIARMLLDPGDRVWVEDPGYPGLRGPLAAAGAELVPVAVDAEGLLPAAGQRAAPGARMAVVTPSHQFPLGITMSLKRRLELLAWARDAGAWILEDDYDSEFRYDGRPLAALQGLDEDGRVIYVGTFSKVLFPSLRLGYLVVPPALVEPLLRGRAALDDHPSALVQPVIAQFIEEGHFAAHVRRMRRLYGTRQEVLLAAARARLGGLVELAPDGAGMHLVGRLGPELAGRMDDRAAVAAAAEAGVTLAALSAYFLDLPTRQGLLLGYAGVPEPEIEAAVERLAGALGG